MACRGVLFALDADDQAALLAAATPEKPKGWKALFGLGGGTPDRDEQVMAVIEAIEERWDEDWLCETDKAWDAIHRALSGSRLDFALSSPRNGVILGGRSLHRGEDYLISYKDAALVRDVAAAASTISDEDMGALYDQIDPDQYDGPMDADDRGYTVDNFSEVREFYARAAAAGRSVVFTVDQ